MKREKLFIVFGSTGDLSTRMIFPALEKINKNNLLDKISILGIGRRDFDKVEFVEFLKANSKSSNQYDGIKYKTDYFKLELNNLNDYKNLKTYIEDQYGKQLDIVIYLSISPEYFQTALNNFEKSNLNKIITRIAFEKPFGQDLDTATQLNKGILKIFDEKQIFRIDHYLGKEAIQNIIAFRFSNILFEPIWNNKYIDNIQITASEAIGVENRGEYYDKNGAIRDMLQNHLLQVMSLICMEMPTNLDPESIREAKLNLLKNIQLNGIDEKQIVLGQYKGYKNEKGVKKDSKTETFVAMKLFIKNWRFDGVPIYLRTGKMLKNKETKIVIEFKQIPQTLFNLGGNLLQNRIIIQIAPDEKIMLNFNIKEIGDNNIQNVQAEFNLDGKDIISYEKLLKDLLDGDPTLFTPWNIIQQSWKIVDNIINCKNNCPIVHEYERGTNGPGKPCETLMDGKKWFN